MINAEVSVIGMDDEVPGGQVVVVLDVIRAFTTAAIAFERGATEIVFRRTVPA
jgi:2-phosphosulfolactate phosphatase